MFFHVPAGMPAVMHQRMGFYTAPDGRLLTLGFYSFCNTPRDAPRERSAVIANGTTARSLGRMCASSGVRSSDEARTYGSPEDPANKTGSDPSGSDPVPGSIDFVALTADGRLTSTG